MSQSPRRVIPRSPRTLVLAPTRELAAQIDESFATYGSFMRFRHTVIFGGVGQVPQVKALTAGVDVLVATPGRLQDLMNQGYVRLDHLEFLVLDEVDRMLDMGFIADVKRIIAKLPAHRHSVFFSATMPPKISELAKSLLRNPVRVEVTPQASTVKLVQQKVLFVDEKDKIAILLELLRHEHLKCVLVFTRTKRRANNVAEVLTSRGIRAEAIHGNKSQGQRTRALDSFKSGHSRVLVATDIAARGIDIDDISHVINFDLPSDNIENYVHPHQDEHRGDASHVPFEQGEACGRGGREASAEAAEGPEKARRRPAGHETVPAEMRRSGEREGPRAPRKHHSRLLRRLPVLFPPALLSPHHDCNHGRDHGHDSCQDGDQQVV